jgi:hypothetical protein
MASMPTQDEFLAATRKSQEAMIAAIRTWFETVRTATPKLTSVYAPLTDRLPKLPTVSLPFADKLPTPEQAVDNAYHMAEQLLANQRKFTEDLLDAMTPLGVVQRRCRSGLAQKPLQRGALVIGLLRQELQRYAAMQLGVLSLIHHAHASAAQFAENSVMRDDLPV